MYNNFHTDHIAFAEMPLAIHIQNAISLHISDDKVHITEDERKAWNDKLGQDDLAQILAQLDQKEDKKDGEDIPASEQYVTEEDLKNAITTALSGYITEDRVNCKILAVRRDIPTNITDLTGGSNLVSRPELNNALQNTNLFVRTEDTLFTLNNNPVVFGGSVYISDESSYVLPVASPSLLGGIKVGYSGSEYEYAVNVNDGRAYVDLSDIAATVSSVSSDVANLLQKVGDIPQTNNGECPTAITFKEYLTGITTQTERDLAELYFSNNPFEKYVKLLRTFGGSTYDIYIFRDNLDECIETGTILNPWEFDDYRYKSSRTENPYYSNSTPCVYDAYNDELYAQAYNVRISEEVWPGDVDNIPQFDESTFWFVKDRVFYDGKLWEFVRSHRGPWDSDDVKEVSKVDSLEGLTKYIHIGNHELMFVGGILVGYKASSNVSDDDLDVQEG